jgi:hypothetical protein
LGRDVTNIDAATEGDLRAIIRAGLRRFYYPVVGGATYQWRFLEKYHPFNIEAAYSTGTIAVSGGVVTLTAGTWPLTLADGFISVQGHILFVLVRTNGTSATVSNTQLTIPAGTAFEWFRFRYDLPSDFSEWKGGLVFSDGSENRLLAGTSESEIRLRYAIGQGDNAQTTHYAISAVPSGTEFQIMFWPVPEPDAFIQGVYQAIPADSLPADLTDPGAAVTQVTPIYAEAMLEAVLAAAEQYNNNLQGIHEARFQAALAAAISHDRAIIGHWDFSRDIREYDMGHGLVTEIDFSQALL